MPDSIRPIGFVGLGTMGSAMANRLLDRGRELVVHDRVSSLEDPLVERGARRASSLGAIAEACETVLLSLPGPQQITAVVEAEDGLLAKMPTGGTIVDLSTNSVECARRLSSSCERRGVGFLDAPVSGGSKGSRDGTLVLMVGGDEETVDRVRPVLADLSRQIFLLGGPGCGAATKLVHNQLYLCGEVLFFEALILAAKAGISATSLCEILELSGAGGVHARLVSRVLERRFDDRTFTLGLAEKDVALAIDAGRSLGTPLEATEAAHRLFADGLEEGWGDKNFWSVIELLERRADVEIDQVD